MNLYIAVEGLDGIGKTTFVKNLEKAVEEQYGQFVRTIYEPGTTEAGKELRAMMKSGDYGLSRRSELLMMMAARSDLVEKELYPKFSGFIISDRCWLSTLAYQVTADPGLLEQFRATLDSIAHGYPRGIMFVLDGTLEMVRERGGFKDGRDAIENASEDHWRRRQHMYTSVASGKVLAHDDLTYRHEVDVRQTGISYSNYFFKRVIRIDAAKSPEEQIKFAMEALHQHDAGSIGYIDSNATRIPQRG